MKNLLLSFRFWTWANLFVCGLNGTDVLPVIDHLAAYVFTSSLPVFYLLLLALAGLRALRLPARKAWMVFIGVVVASTLIGSGIMAWRSEAVDWPGAFLFVFTGAVLALLLHSRILHRHFQMFRYETE